MRQVVKVCWLRHRLLPLRRTKLNSCPPLGDSVLCCAAATATVALPCRSRLQNCSDRSYYAEHVKTIDAGSDAMQAGVEVSPLTCSSWSTAAEAVLQLPGRAKARAGANSARGWCKADGDSRSYEGCPSQSLSDDVHRNAQCKMQEQPKDSRTFVHMNACLFAPTWLSS